MPDALAGGFMAMNGTELINSQRTISYVKNFGLPLVLSEGCWCECIQCLLDCEGPKVGYGYPSTDTAPWYSESIPESGDFLGFLPIEFEGLGSTFTRETFEGINGGGVLGRLRARPRTLTWRGLFFGRTACAAEYGLRWMTSRLAASSGCAGCSGAEMDILYCCIDGGEEGGCGASENAPDIGAQPNSDAFRTFYKVGLVDGPKKLSDRIIGCSGCTNKTLVADCGTCSQGDGTPCGGGAMIIEAEFSVIAGNPYMFRDPIEVCTKPLSDAACGDCGSPGFVQWVKKGEDESCGCGATANSGCLVDPQNLNCNPDDLPKIPEFVDPCGGCDPLDERTVCCEITDATYGEFFEAALSLEIYSGDLPLRNVSVRVFENPQRRSCADPVAIDSCNQCDSLKVRFIPAESTLRIDGINRRIEIECPGQEPQPGESLTISPFRYPVLTCNPYLVTASVDCNNEISPDATFKIIVNPREM